LEPSCPRRRLYSCDSSSPPTIPIARLSRINQITDVFAVNNTKSISTSASFLATNATRYAKITASDTTVTQSLG